MTSDERRSASSNEERGFRRGGLGGRPSLDTGEPVLARWFVLFLLVAVPLGIVVSVWAALSLSGDPLSPAERRPPGTTQYTHDRGRADLAEARDTEPGPACAGGVTLVGDDGGRATGRRALQALCDAMLDGVVAPEVVEGLRAWQVSRGVLRVAAFELTGVDATSRIEDGVVVVELNAKFQFDDAAEAMPLIAHELVHLAQGWPLEAVSAGQELAAMQAQFDLCQEVRFRGAPPRGCLDAQELLDLADPLAALVEAGFGD